MGETILKDPQEIVEGFNEYFSNIGPDLANEIDMFNCNFETYVKETKSEFAAFQPKTASEIFNLLCGLSGKIATRIDKISLYNYLTKFGLLSNSRAARPAKNFVRWHFFVRSW